MTIVWPNFGEKENMVKGCYVPGGPQCQQCEPSGGRAEACPRHRFGQAMHRPRGSDVACGDWPWPEIIVMFA